MTFTGSQLVVQRSFYDQTGTFGFGFSCTVDNTTGTYHFGVSGTQGNLEFTMQSGHLSYQNEFIHSYRSNEQFLIRADFSTGHANIVRNGSALIYGEPKATGSFNYFYMNRENVGMGATLDVSISGDSFPRFSVTNQGYLFSSGQNAVTGFFVNQSTYPIRIFDNQNQASDLYSYGKLVGNVAGGQSGVFAYSGNLNSFDLTQPILTTFNTNFGDTSILFTIIDARSLPLVVQITAPTDFTFNDTGVLNRNLSYLNYSGGFATNAYNAGFSFSLGYSSGINLFTGAWDVLTGLSATTLVSMKRAGQFNSTMISGSGFFPPNSTINFQVNHTSTGGFQDAAQFVVSGQYVIDPIVQLLVN